MSKKNAEQVPVYDIKLMIHLSQIYLDEIARVVRELMPSATNIYVDKRIMTLNFFSPLDTNTNAPSEITFCGAIKFSKENGEIILKWQCNFVCDTEGESLLEIRITFDSSNSKKLEKIGKKLATNLQHVLRTEKSLAILKKSIIYLPA